MTNPSALLRSIIIYAICVPVALLLGYMLASPTDWASFGTIGGVFLILLVPLLLRFHYPLLVLGWNMSMIVFFLPGAPQVWMPLVAISFLISIVRRTIDQRFRFISVPELTRPLLAIAVVALVTAEATGGIHLRSLGGEVYGGKRYIILLGSIMGYFALTAQRIPLERAGLYVGLFLLGGLTILMGDVLYFQSRTLYFLFLFFPPYIGAMEAQTGMVRLAGVGGVASLVTVFMLAKYGVQGIFSGRQPWRAALFLCCAVVSLSGGFRSKLIGLILTFSIQFCLEGLHRTKLLPILLFVSVLAASISLPFVEKLPYNFQRALSFLPIPVNPVARMDAEGTARWRWDIWIAVLPQVPKYLFLGKGLALTREDFEFSVAQSMHTFAAQSEQESWAALAQEYHNGPLSVIIPFGIWGVLAFLWFLTASVRALYCNYRYGDPNLRIVNAFLLAVYITKILTFVFIVGGFYGDMQIFIGYLGFSVSLNGGVARPVPEPAPDAAKETGFANMLPRRRSAFER